MKPCTYGVRMWNVLLATTVALLMSGCSDKQAGPGGGMSMPPMPVELAEAVTQTVADRFDAVGTVEANEGASIVSEIDGLVTRLPFDEGSAIRRGQLIAQLDESQLAAEVDRTEALLAQSKTSYDRIKTVVDLKAGSPQELDDAAAALGVAQANLALSKARLAKSKIVAPFDGIVGARRVSIGTFVRAGDKITELANIDEIRVVFSAPERFLSSLARGAEVTASAPAFPDQVLTGSIIAIDPILDPQTRSARVVARLANTGQRFRPGMSANVSAILAQRDNAITIPNEAVFASGAQSFVFVVNADNTVARAAITLGTRMADMVEVTSGLEAGAKVVKAGHQKLFDGAKVMGAQGGPPSAGQPTEGQPPDTSKP